MGGSLQGSALASVWATSETRTEREVLCCCRRGAVPVDDLSLSENTRGRRGDAGWKTLNRVDSANRLKDPEEKRRNPEARHPCLRGAEGTRIGSAGIPVLNCGLSQGALDGHGRERVQAQRIAQIRILEEGNALDVQQAQLFLCQLQSSFGDTMDTAMLAE